MNKEQLDAIKGRVANATPGEWGLGVYRVYNDKFKAVAETLRFEDAKFIAHARQDISALIAEIERLSEDYEAADDLFHRTNEQLGYEYEENKRLREVLEFYADEETYYPEILEGLIPVLEDNGKKARRALGDDDE